MAKVLLCEDDVRFAKTLRATLAGMRHTVEHVVTVEEALELVDAFEFELLILDWELPGMAGIDACSKFKQISPDMPILMLTAKTAPQDAVIGLDKGADDYIRKPCDADELSARIRALLRRGHDRASGLKCGLLTIELQACKAVYGET